MAISAKWVKKQLMLVQPILSHLNIDGVRIGQARLGELMARSHKSKVSYARQVFRDFVGEWVAPKTKKQDGVILYLHGGGYVSGDIEYARGFGTILAARSGIPVFCAAYRLSPEHPYPAALEDAYTAYLHLLDSGYRSKQIILCGESAGGGLIYALALHLKAEGREMPAGIAAISPWTDLTMEGQSYLKNRDKDPTLSYDTLRFYVTQYTQEPENPYVSPLFGALAGLPPSLLFAGGDELLLDDAVRMHDALLLAGCSSRLVVAPGMWHVYLLYGTKEAQCDYEALSAFFRELLTAQA